MEKNLLDIYKQSKQRVDIEIDFTNKKVIGKTVLTFTLKNDTNLKTNNPPDSYYLKLNSDNMIIKSINFQMKNFSDNENLLTNKKTYNLSFNTSNKNKNFGNNSEEEKIINKKLNYSYISPENYEEYLKNLYNCVEDKESLNNLNRIEWENKIEGSLNIEVLKDHLLKDSNDSENDLNGNNNEQYKEKIKICIDYELYSDYTGIIFQFFYDEKIDSEYEVCYTPNFVRYIIF